MKRRRDHKHLFPIINAMVESAVAECEEDGETISCAAGCDHCCHLFIEVSWEEAEELADWIESRPSAERTQCIQRVQENAKRGREVLAREKSARHLLTPYIGDKETPDSIFDAYFFEHLIPCMFLSEEKTCSAYAARPTACRLHMVSSDPHLCSREIEDDDGYEIPQAIETLKEEAAPAITALERDGRWGHFGITLEAVLHERGLIVLENPAALASPGA